MNNIDMKIKPVISLTLNNLVNEIEEVLKLRSEISISERDSFKTYLNDILDLVGDDEDLLTPEIIMKINDIKHILEDNDNYHEGKISPLLSPPLTDTQVVVNLDGTDHTITMRTAYAADTNVWGLHNWLKRDNARYHSASTSLGPITGTLNSNWAINKSNGAFKQAYVTDSFTIKYQMSLTTSDVISLVGVELSPNGANPGLQMFITPPIPKTNLNVFSFIISYTFARV
jgi:hypothetical protein